MNKKTINFFLDVWMFLAFLAATVSGLILWWFMSTHQTTVFAGIDRSNWVFIHLGSCLSSLVGVIFHIIMHRNWLKALRGRPMAGLSKTVRKNRVIDRIVWFSFLCSILSGTVSWIFTNFVTTSTIKPVIVVHVAASLFCIVFAIIHLVLHKKWVISMTREALPESIRSRHERSLV